MDLITRRVIAKREGENVSREVLDTYADPDSQNYKEMLEEIEKELNFTTLHFHRLDDLLASIGIEPCKVCTYCFNGNKYIKKTSSQKYSRYLSSLIPVRMFFICFNPICCSSAILHPGQTGNVSLSPDP